MGEWGHGLRSWRLVLGPAKLDTKCYFLNGLWMKRTGAGYSQFFHNALYTLNTRVSRVSCKFYLKAKGTAFEAPAADVPGFEQRTGSAHSRRQVTTHQRFQLGNIGKLPLDH